MKLHYYIRKEEFFYLHFNKDRCWPETLSGIFAHNVFEFDKPPPWRSIIKLLWPTFCRVPGAFDNTGVGVCCFFRYWPQVNFSIFSNPFLVALILTLTAIFKQSWWPKDVMYQKWGNSPKMLIQFPKPNLFWSKFVMKSNLSFSDSIFNHSHLSTFLPRAPSLGS